MQNQHIDNRVDLGDVILWQYQNAVNLKKLVQSYADFFQTNVKNFHDDWCNKIFNIEPTDNQELDRFSLSLWGAVLGYSRPTYKVGDSETPITDASYRKLLKARFRVMRSNGSLTSILKYLNDAFDGEVTVRDTADMALHFSVKYPNHLGELNNVLSQNPDSVLVYPAGVKTNDLVDEIVFGFSGQQNNLASGDPKVGGFDDSTYIT